MPTEKMIRFGLLGAGLIAPMHAKAIRAAGGCELAAVADPDAPRAEAFAREYSCKAYASMEQLLGDRAIDVVCVLTPNPLHRAGALAGIMAGKSVLVEKPPALSLPDLDEMTAAAARAGVQLGVVLQCRTRPPIQAMKAAVAEGRFGRILHADAFLKWFRTAEYFAAAPWRRLKESGAGVTMHLAFHYIDLLLYLAGPASSVTARMCNLAHPQVELEDTASALLEFRCGARGVVEASTALWPGQDVLVEIHGENGSAVMAGDRMETWTFRDERPEDEAARKLGERAVSSASGPADLGFRDHQVLIEDMADAVRTGREPLIPAASARPTLELVLAMYQSAATGKTVTLPK